MNQSQGTYPPNNNRTYLRYLTHPMYQICLAFLVLGILTKFFVYYVWDDSYMFVRYADNLRHFGAIAWNPNGDPTYGLTSLLYLGIVLPIRTLFPTEPAITAAGSSLVCGVAFVVLMLWLARKYSDWNTGTRLLVCFAFGNAATHLSALMMSGMDTMLALSYLTLYIAAVKRYESRSEQKEGTSKPRRILALSAFGSLAFLVRPDLLLFTCTVPLAMTVFSTQKSSRLDAVKIIALTGLLVGIQMLLAKLYFGTPVPLPFFAKTQNLYGAHIASQYDVIPYKHLKIFVLGYAPIFGIIVAALFFVRQSWKTLLSAAEKGLLIASIGFIAYYYFFVLQIMPFSARFYHPALPPLLFVACRLLPSLAEWIQTQFRAWKQNLVRIVLLLAVGVPTMGLSGIGWYDSVSAIRKDIVMNEREHNFAEFNINDMYRKFNGDQFLFGLQRFSTLPDSMVIATTEVGLLSVMNPNKQVIDMAGLNQKEFALHPFSADTLLMKYKPDLIYLPHPDYTTMIRALQEHPEFKTNYTFYSSKTLDALMSIAVRNNGKYTQDITRVIEDILNTKQQHH